jgi:ComF family protein
MNKIRRGLQFFIKEIKDRLFPIFCINCQKEGKWLCNICFAKLDLKFESKCCICGKNTKDGRCCESCSSSSFLFHHFFLSKYNEDDIIGKLIYLLKYSYIEDVNQVIFKMLDDFFTNGYCANVLRGFDMIIPVPLHKKRLAERGFNQSLVIGNELAKIIALPISELIIRKKYTLQQAALARQARLENVRDAFFVLNNKKINGKKIILVDDVLTTGSTLQECAKALLSAGALEVSCFTLARG